MSRRSSSPNAVRRRRRRSRVASPNAALSTARRCGNNAQSWNTKPTPRFSGRDETAGAGYLGAADRDAPRVLSLEAGGDSQQGGLAASRRPQEAHDLPAPHREIHAPDHRRRTVGVMDALEGEPVRRGSAPHRLSGRHRSSGILQVQVVFVIMWGKHIVHTRSRLPKSRGPETAAGHRVKPARTAIDDFTSFLLTISPASY